MGSVSFDGDQGRGDSPYKKPKGKSKLLTVKWEGDEALSDLERDCSFFKCFLKHVYYFHNRVKIYSVSGE